MPQHPIRAELHLSVIQDIVTSNLSVELQSKVSNKAPQVSLSNVGATQVFTRLQEILNNHLRIVCNQLEEQLKNQRQQS